MLDVIIIGGGPAGTAAAIRLSRIGMKVRLYEKSRFPRPKLCGGFLGAEALSDLEDLGILKPLRATGALPLRRMIIASRQGTLVEAPLPGEALSISRRIMDDLLLQQARDAGADVRLEQDGFHQNDTSRYTVIATGRQVTPLSHRGPTDFTPWYASPPVTYFGLQASFENVRDMTDQVELDLIESGYVGFARQSDGTVNVCTLTTQEAVERWGPSLDDVLIHFSQENPILRAHLAGAKRIGSWMTVGPVRLGIRSLAQDRTFYVGDAACVVDPFAGEGMAMGMYSSQLLAQALAQNKVPPAALYSRLWKQAFMPALRWNAIARMLYSVRLFREPSLRYLQSFPNRLTWLTNLTRHRQIGDSMLEGMKRFKTIAGYFLVL